MGGIEGLWLPLGATDEAAAERDRQSAWMS